MSDAAARPPRPLAVADRLWGPVRLADGSVRFRLWAPDVERLSLRLEDGDRPMAAAGGGWFEAAIGGVAPGAAYAFVLPDGMVVPDPAAHRQAGGVHGWSRLAEPAHRWKTENWRGRPWQEAVIYELHVGAFTPEGTFDAARRKLHHLAELGVTAIELMPVAQFAGERGWGYDGVLPFAPHPAYGEPDALRRLVDAAHEAGLMVMLDVVYNHFGPEGNYLHLYAGNFFNTARQTPWGPAIAYHRAPVRRFFIENALYWLEEFRLDGLRLDAIDQIRDLHSDTDILEELALEVRRRTGDRQVHLTTEDNRNLTHLHRRDAAGQVPLYTAEWNDDFHNAAHVLATGETGSYYADFSDNPLGLLGRALAEGFSYQGEHSGHAGGPRGERSTQLPPTAFINFLQNHDQIGNRAEGERLHTLTHPDTAWLLTVVLILAPHIPLIFMGDEFRAEEPFMFFTDFEGELADTVRSGRRAEFPHFAALGEDVPDPNALETFRLSRLDWDAARNPAAEARLARMRELIALRHRHVVPLLETGNGAGRLIKAADGVVAVHWQFGGGSLDLRLNLADDTRLALPADGAAIYDSAPEARQLPGVLPPHSVLVRATPLEAA